MTPKQAAKEVRKKAKEAGESIWEYCAKRGVGLATITRWEKYGQKTVRIETLRKLGIDE